MVRERASDRHIPSLDGVRAIAILAVFWYHATLMSAGPGEVASLAHWGDWGWAGVDLFFTLSGYLITGVLIDTCGEPGYYSAFYSRRALRIIPAYVTYLSVLLLIMGAQMRAEQGWFWSYAANIHFAITRWTNTVPGTDHLWSLSVEEQFYLVWPFVFAKCRSARGAMWIALSVAASSALLRSCGVLLWGLSAPAMYVLTPTHADGLAIGAFLASAMRFPMGNALVRAMAGPLVVTGSAALLFVVLRLHGSFSWASPSMQVIGYPGFALISGGLVAYATTRQNLAVSALSAAPLRAIGRLSYGAYLWHPLVMWLLQHREGLHGMVFVLASAILTAAPVSISWWCIERPVLRLKRHMQVRPSEVAAQAVAGNLS